MPEKRQGLLFTSAISDQSHRVLNYILFYYIHLRNVKQTNKKSVTECRTIPLYLSRSKWLILYLAFPVIWSTESQLTNSKQEICELHNYFMRSLFRYACIQLISSNFQFRLTLFSVFVEICIWSWELEHKGIQ